MVESATVSDTNSLLRSRTHSSSSSLTALNKTHQFHSVTFTKPTYCDLCNNFIWGVVKQGHSCLDCGFNTHKKCCSLVTSPCVPHPSGKGGSSSGVSVLGKANGIPAAAQAEERDIVTELFAETQVQSRKLGNVLTESNPALSMALFMKNNQRYTNRQYPFIWVNETVIKLLTWDSVPNTLIFLLCYIIVCK
ncbi:RAS guanyl-releasing protein 4 [Kappamyces sp. JEL0829]|nr:RAS guanyl-releasing protein 4 [Kappamyces sp. JEL0829]